MSRILPVLFVLLSFLALSFAEEGKPNMVIDHEIYDAGVVPRTGTPIEHAFRIKNTGTGDLRILSVKPG